MNLPKLTAFAETENRTDRFEIAIKILEDGLANKHIWNVDYVEAKDGLSGLTHRALEAAAEWYLKQDPRPTWESNDPRWMVWYTPDFHNMPGAVKKLMKYKGTMGAGFDNELAVMVEIAQLAELVKAVKPFIVKGRKPSENPTEKDESNTGECPVCMKRQKLTFEGTMVAHGYTIPRGWGGRNGMCMGRGYKAWELSPDGAVAFKKMMESYLKDLKKLLVNLKGSKSPSLSEKVSIRKGFGHYEDETHTYNKGTPEYERIRETEIFKAGNAIDSITTSITEVGDRISNWKAQPLAFGGAETQERWKSRMLNKKQ